MSDGQSFVLRYELHHDFRSMNFGVVNDNGQLSLNVSKEVGQERDKSRSLDGALVGLLKKLALGSDATNDRELVMLQEFLPNLARPFRGSGKLEEYYGKATQNLVT